MSLAAVSASQRRALVTGGRGYLGVQLGKALGEAGYHVCRLARTAPATADLAVEDLTGDVRDRSVLASAAGVAQLIFHLAGQTSVYVANDNPVEDQASNVLPILYLLEACARADHHPTVILAGTVTSCGLSARLPVNESQLDQPVTIYDLHKLMAEHYLGYYVRQGVVTGGTLRLANVYGPGPKSGAPDRGILNAMVRRALKGEPLTVFGDGEQLRDYVYTEDVIAAFMAAARHASALNGGYFVIGTGQGHTIAEAVHLVAERVEAKTGIKAPVVHVSPNRQQSPIELRNFVADSTRFAELAGWTPKIGLCEGIDRTIASLLAGGLPT